MGKHSSSSSKPKILIFIILLLVIGIGVGGYLYLTEFKTGEPGVVFKKVSDIEIKPKLDRPIRILILGVDSFVRNKTTGHRSDVFIIFQINPDKTAYMVSVLRDSLVAIPGHGNEKITHAFAYGGPELSLETLKNLSGLDMDYYLVTTFPGFQNLINAVGGLDINVDMNISDRWAGAYFQEGSTHMNGAQALSFARSRHLVGDNWTRSRHHQDIILAALEQEKKRTRNLVDLVKIMPALQADVITNVEPRELYWLAKLFLSLERKNVKRIYLKGQDSMVGGASVVLLDEGYANQVFSELKEAK